VAARRTDGIGVAYTRYSIYMYAVARKNYDRGLSSLLGDQFWALNVLDESSTSSLSWSTGVAYMESRGAACGCRVIDCLMILQ